MKGICAGLVVVFVLAVSAKPATTQFRMPGHAPTAQHDAQQAGGDQ